MDTRETILTKPVRILLIRFGLPSVLAMIINTLYSVVDRIFVGKGVGEDALAAITVCFPMLMIMMALGMLIALGGSTLISLYLGQDNRARAEKVVGNGFTIIVVTMGLFMVGIMFNLERLLYLFGANEATIGDARSYMLIILLGSIPHEIGFGINTYIRGEGNIRYSVTTSIVGALANILFDYLLVFVIPLGVKGVAIGTVSAWSIRMMMVLAFYYRKKGLLRFRARDIKPDFQLIGRMLSIGLAPCSMQLLGSAALIYLNRSLLHYGGNTAVALYGVGMSLFQVVAMFVRGMGAGAQPIIGFNFGAGQYERVRRCLADLGSATVLVSAAGAALLVSFPVFFLSLFTGNASGLVELGPTCLRIYVCMLPFAGVNMLILQYFQSVGRAGKALLLSVCRLGIFMPACLLFITNLISPTLFGVWIALPAADFLAGALSLALIIPEWRGALRRANEPLGTKP